MAYGLTKKEVTEITGLGENAVKDIGLQRLKGKYTLDGEKLIKPERPSRFLGIDEFKFHNGHKYAVVIIDMETGHILLSGALKEESHSLFIHRACESWVNGWRRGGRLRYEQ